MAASCHSNSRQKGFRQVPGAHSYNWYVYFFSAYAQSSRNYLNNFDFSYEGCPKSSWTHVILFKITAPLSGKGGSFGDLNKAD
uniref:Uncharacterized protein n=1 Tax=Magallana gigas TaxID=29159 RepID=K1PPW2_MAGGI